MCDTIAIVRPSGVLFAKNSDRDANEAQVLEWHGARDHPAGARLECTWLEIPEVEHTYATVLSRPFWMWGAEMGANEHGVAIGNEAVFTRQPYATAGLTGMDLVRLALERADTAQRACEAITALLEEHGQGGGCGHEHRGFTYHNSFIVADPASAYVLETAGRHWAIEAVAGARTISNGLTIPGFAEKHSDFLKTRVSACRARQARTQALADQAGDVADLFSILRDHGAGRAEPRYALASGGLGAPCVHAAGVLVATQTTGSWVADLRPDGSRHWVTGTAAPCTALFKPVRVDRPLDLGPAPRDVTDDSVWWRHERLHRAVMRDPGELRPLFAPERDATETGWLGDPPDSEAAFKEAGDLLEKWTAAVAAHPVRDQRPPLVRRYWARRNRRAGWAPP